MQGHARGAAQHTARRGVGSSCQANLRRAALQLQMLPVNSRLLLLLLLQTLLPLLLLLLQVRLPGPGAAHRRPACMGRSVGRM